MLEPLGGTPLDQRSRKGSKKIFIIIGLVVIFPIILTVGIIAVVFGGIYYGTKSTEEYTCAMSEIRKSDKGREILGDSIEDGYFVMPNIEISGARREVYLSVPVSGSKSSGTLTINSYRDNFRSNFLVFLEADEKQIEIYRGVYPCE